MWCRYGALRLIDIPHLRTVMPLTMEDFMESVRKTSAEGAELLSDDWIAECCDIVDDNREAIEQWMPPDGEEVKRDDVVTGQWHSQARIEKQCMLFVCFAWVCWSLG